MLNTRYARYLLRIAFLVSVFIAGTGSAYSAEPISFGLRTQDWHFMWVGGKSLQDNVNINKADLIKWDVSEKNLDKYAELNAQWNIVALRQDVDGPDGFLRAKKAVAEHQRRGIKVIFRLIEDPMVYDRLAINESAEFGFEKNYYQWVRSIADTFQSQVQYYMIGNEVDHDLGHNLLKYEKRLVSYEQYKKVLNTAYQAIKNVNPSLKVVDHGVSSYSLGLAIADDLFRGGHPFEAYEFWKEFNYGRDKQIVGRINFPFMFSDEGVRHRIEIVRESYIHPGKSDLIQFHYYADWRSLPRTLQWVNARMLEGKAVRPLLAAEVGYRIPPKVGKTWDGRKTDVGDFSLYSEDDHAENLVKDFSILLGSGVSHALYWQGRFHHDRDTTGTLFKATEVASEFTPYKAAIAYQFIAKNLNGLNVNPVKKLVFPGVSEYRFGGANDVSVVWANAGNVSISAKEMPAIQEMRGMLGEKIAALPDGKVLIGTRPIYVFWRAANK